MAGKKRIPRSEMTPRYFSENFEQHIRPTISDKLSNALETAFDYDALNRMSLNEKRELAKYLSRTANRRISGYLRSTYYKNTEEYLKSIGADTSTADVTPFAYANLARDYGEIKKFTSGKAIDKLKVGQVNAEITRLRQFLAAESSRLGKKDTGGFLRIKQQRLENFKKALKTRNVKIDEDFLESEMFSKRFWGVFNRVRKSLEGTMDKKYYQKEQFMGLIAEEVYDNFYVQDFDIEQISLKIIDKFNTGTYETKQQVDDDGMSMSANIREVYGTGRKD